MQFKHIKISNLGTEDVELLNSDIEDAKTDKKSETKFRELKIKNIVKILLFVINLFNNKENIIIRMDVLAK
jgi:hypothetical protein